MTIANRTDFEDFMARADAAERWDDIEPEEWNAACEYAGISYHDYSDPDRLWDALTEALEK